ncbi:hypothetical protein [Stieleria varia]|nr:hypothetical protein [Stieleria varia]
MSQLIVRNLLAVKSIIRMNNPVNNPGERVVDLVDIGNFIVRPKREKR